MSPEAQPLRVPSGAALVVRMGTLLRTNLRLESAFASARRLFGAPVTVDPATLPLDEALVQRLRTARAAGRRVVLVAETDRPFAEALAGRLDVFDAVVIGGADAQSQLARDEPGHEVVTPTPRAPGALVKASLRALRPHQWTKNALLFVPALLAHSRDAEVWLHALWAFGAFSLCASSVYVLNDLLDLHADRAHHHKRSRPFASGAVPLGFGLLAAPLLLAGAFAVGLLLPPLFTLVLGVYYAATLAYSLVLKRLVLVDVLVLAGLYTVRIIAGGVAVGVTVSQWLLAFSLFLFLSLAYVKRYSEVAALRKKGIDEAQGRGYRAVDLELLQSLGASAGFISVLVMALYVNSQDVTRLYTHPERLWALLPLLLYWISRVWLLAHRGQMHDDPIVFAIRDRVSYVVALLVGAAVLLAI